MLAPVRNPASSAHRKTQASAISSTSAEPVDRMPPEQLALEGAVVVHRLHHGLVQLGRDHARHERVGADAAAGRTRPRCGRRACSGRPWRCRSAQSPAHTVIAHTLELMWTIAPPPAASMCGIADSRDQERRAQVGGQDAVELGDVPVGQLRPVGGVDARRCTRARRGHRAPPPRRRRPTARRPRSRDRRAPRRPSRPRPRSRRPCAACARGRGRRRRRPPPPRRTGWPPRGRCRSTRR